MKITLIIIFGAALILGCTKSSVRSDDTTSFDSSTNPVADVMPYEKLDSVFNINGKLFSVNLSHYDLTEIATAQGDTLSRPTYSCTLKIFDSEKKMVFSDSLLRDSWGFKGMIRSVDFYELQFPEISIEDQKILFSFNISERIDGEAILGQITFHTDSLTAKYSWKEFMSGE